VLGGRPVGILGTGAYAPEAILTNEQLAKMVDTSDEWIRSRTGIRERHIAAANQATSDLALVASQRALEAAGLKPDDLDMIVVGTATPDYPFPSTACRLQHKLGATRCGAMDVSAACSGFLYAMNVGASFIASGQAKNVLVLGAEILSRITDYSDRNTCVLFGDGAGAVVLSAGGPHRFLGGAMHSDGKDPDVLSLPAGGSVLPASQRTIDEKKHFITLRGRDIFRFAVTRMVELVEAAIAAEGVKAEDVRLIIPHQVNARIIESAVDKIGLPQERIYCNIERFGNTSTASIPMALDEVVKKGMLKEGDLVVFVAFGGGLTWASATVRW